ncbi:kalirin-like protein [Cricetulus griseus]|uniref:Kalirin-like protein n=1 Tax=Cricetulus griseus TaxID=10029 RepID=A0A061I2T7_CRIGR|nr:kalirin-like protein [Cricetulus griseus]
MKGGDQAYSRGPSLGWFFAKCCCCFPCRDSYSHSSSENGGKSESVANLQSQHSLNSIHSSPGPKRSTNTLKKWLTSPVRRLNSGKADGNIKKQKKVRDGRKSFDLGSPKPGDETTPQGDSADEKSKKGWGEDEPDEESHTPLPPPMKIFDNDPTQDEMTLEGGSYRGSLKDPTGCLNEGMTPPTPPRNLEEEQKAKALRGRMFVLNELVQTEKDYVKDLGIVVEVSRQQGEEPPVIYFIIERRCLPKKCDFLLFSPLVFSWLNWKNVSKSKTDWLSSSLNISSWLCLLSLSTLERKLHIYVWYCQNKPRSEYIVAEYDAYFEEVKQEINQRLTLSDFLIKPIQRITKYQLLLKDFLRYSEKAGLECSDIEKAVELMCLVPKRCNDMMNLGRLQGFEGTLTAQGKLLQQDTFYVIELDAGMQSRTKERRVFLFEQIVIFSELLRKGSLTPGYMFKRSIKMNYLVLEENVDSDPCKFALMNRETSERVILQAANSDIQQAWVQDINQVLETQRDFLNALQSPIEYQRKERNTAVVRSQPPRVPQASPRPYSSVPVGSEKPPKGSSYNPPLPPLKISTSNGSPGFDYHQPGDKFEASKQNDLSGCNGTSSMAVIKDYYALKENEICVSQGEVVQVLAVNQQNMCLVYQPASDHSPAAEGWVPGSILAPLTKATAAAESSDGSIKKSCSWHTLRMRKRAEVENTGKNEATGPRKPKDILGNKVSVKILNPNFIQEGVPAAPNRPIAQERSCTSVILRWLPPASTGNCTISGYTVEYREEGSQVWQQSVASTLDTYLVIEDLSPGCPYQFRVSASNPWGISLPSEASEFVRLPEMDDGRLLDYLMNHDELMEEKVAFYIRDIMEALQYLHNCRVAHLDIKPENLLIDLRIPVPRVKLIDLEDAVQISGHFHIHHLLGNPEFAAPEVIQGIPVSLGTDIWSIGVLTYVMLSGVSPFLDESKEETCINVCRVDFSFPHEYFCGVSNAARDFINVILQEDFRRRPTAATCLQHPWLQPHNGSYSKIPLDTSRLACFIERRKHQNDVRPIPNVKSYIVNRVNQGT